MRSPSNSTCLSASSSSCSDTSSRSTASISRRVHDGPPSSKQLGRDDREGRDRDGNVDADRPFEYVDVGLGREVALSAADGDRDGFGVRRLHPRSFEGLGGAECVEGGSVHGWITMFLLRRRSYSETRVGVRFEAQPLGRARLPGYLPNTTAIIQPVAYLSRSMNAPAGGGGSTRSSGSIRYQRIALSQNIRRRSASENRLVISRKPRMMVP